MHLLTQDLVPVKKTMGVVHTEETAINFQSKVIGNIQERLVDHLLRANSRICSCFGIIKDLQAQRMVI